MTEKQIHEKYIETLEKSCPDMDRLWLHISEKEPESCDISPFVKAQNECRSRKKLHLRAAACAAALIIAVIGLRGISGSKANESENFGFSTNNKIISDLPSDGDSDNEYSEEENSAENTVAAVSSWEYSSRFDHASSYSDLTLAPTNSPASTGIDSIPEEYFVEENVLADTDYFLDCKIISAEQTHNAVRYEAEVIHFISDNDAETSRTVTVVSRSPYALREGREYLLPIEEADGERRVVFDNAPQIEFTADRLVVCHNGWEFAWEGAAIEYPQVYRDDYFFDRMNITAESALDSLFDKWRRLAGNS